MYTSLDIRCCDWDTFLFGFISKAREVGFPLLMVNRCLARHMWRYYACTGAEALMYQYTAIMHSDELYVNRDWRR